MSKQASFTSIYVDFAAREACERMRKCLRESRPSKNKNPTISERCKGQNDLADMRARLHARVRGRRLDEREGAVDQRPDLSRGDQRQHMRLDGLCDRDLVGDRARAQSRARVVRPLSQ